MTFGVNSIWETYVRMPLQYNSAHWPCTELAERKPQAYEEMCLELKQGAVLILGNSDEGEMPADDCFVHFNPFMAHWNLGLSDTRSTSGALHIHADCVQIQSCYGKHNAVSPIEQVTKNGPAGGDTTAVMSDLSDRIETFFRRPTKLRHDSTLRVGPLVLDLIERTVMRDDHNVNPLPNEFHLLQFLMDHANEVVIREKLLTEVWQYRAIPKTNRVDVHFGKPRKNIDLVNKPAVLHSVWSLGFVPEG